MALNYENKSVLFKLYLSHLFYTINFLLQLQNSVEMVAVFWYHIYSYMHIYKWLQALICL